MAVIRSNLVAVRAGLDAVPRALTFVAPGRSRGKFGLDVVDAIARGVRSQTVDAQLDPEDSPLHRLSPRTLARKRRLGYPETISLETGEMMAMEEIRGAFVVTAGRVEMTHGAGASARVKGEWFSEGNRKQNRPARKFYALNRHTVRSLDALTDEVLDKNAASAGCT